MYRHHMEEEGPHHHHHHLDPQARTRPEHHDGAFVVVPPLPVAWRDLLHVAVARKSPDLLRELFAVSFPSSYPGHPLLRVDINAPSSRAGLPPLHLGTLAPTPPLVLHES